MVDESEGLLRKQRVTGKINMSGVDEGVCSSMYQQFYGAHQLEEGFIVRESQQCFMIRAEPKDGKESRAE